MKQRNERLTLRDAKNLGKAVFYLTTFNIDKFNKLPLNTMKIRGKK